MKIIFVGSQTIGWMCFKELLKMNQEVVAAITFKPPAHENWGHSVAEVAKEEGIPLFYCTDINSKEIVEELRKFEPDLMLVVGWRWLIKKEVFNMPKLGTFGLHASLLPKLRGYASINWAVITDEKYTGISLFCIGEGIDTGDIIGQEKVIIDEKDDIASLKNKVEIAAVKLTRKYLPLIENGTAQRIKQDHTKATYGCSRTPDDGYINWNKSSRYLYNFIRALTKPYPCAFTFYKGTKIFVLKASPYNESPKYVGTAGQIAMRIKGKGVVIVTGDGMILLERVQAEGEGEIDAYNYFKTTRGRLGLNIHDLYEMLGESNKK